MAIELRHEEVLYIIGLDKTKKDMIVLGALLKAQKEPYDFIDFETLREQLTIDEGSRKGKDSLIYRSLSSLEKEGFLKIDKSGHKHGYNSNIALIENALEKIVLKNTKTLNRDLKSVDSDVETLSDMNSDAMASSVINLAAGKTKIEKPVFVQGWDNIVKMVGDKVYKGLTKGDVVRISLEWLSQTDYMNPSGLMNAEKIMEKGVEFRSLDHDRGEKEFRKNIQGFVVKLRENGRNVGYRILPRKDATYQFIARNTEGIVLVVSESPLSATWVPRNSNPELVDNAIDSFDYDYELGLDLLDFEG
ncbi:MAG: hypothetical protein ACW96M_04330 [Candidatus Thorarchaeota archaeon]